MKITTSLILTIGIYCNLLNNAAIAQVNCANDRVPPTVLTCPQDFTMAISGGVCTPTIYWAPPTGFDDCHTTTFGFTNTTSFANWTQQVSGAGGTAQFSDFTPDSIRIRGTIGGTTANNSNAIMCYTAACHGTISFNWRARRTGLSASFTGDHAFYSLNGNNVQLTPGGLANFATGTVSITVHTGDILCFFVQSNNFGPQTYLTIHNFIYDNLLITQTVGPKPDSSPGAGNGTPVGAGTYPVEYHIQDCAGNISVCSFTFTLTDAPPTITCPSNATILLDTFDCNRVYCYNVEASDNCINTNPVLPPGYQFLGIHNGNTYFISPPGLGNQTNWLTANTIAAQLGGHLVTIEDAAENNFLTSNISTVAGLFDNQYWIGLRYFPIVGDYKWTTGEPLGFTNWGPLQPGFIDGDYVFFWDLIAGTWYDLPNDFFSRRHIIEFEGGVQLKLISGIPSGNPFPPGVTTNVYQACDANGQTSTCSFSVNVIGSTSISCKNINVSLDENCQALITPAMLLAGSYNCYDVFEVSLTYYGQPVPNPVDSHYLNKHLVATVTDPTTGNSCWSDVVIEDKLAPTIICRADTTDCYLFHHDFPLNYEGSDCSHYSVKTIDERIEHLYCNEEYLKVVYRDLQITDYNGLTDVCTDTILVERITADDIDIYLPQYKLNCSKPFELDENGHPSPQLTGLPGFTLHNGYWHLIWPLNELLDCNIWVGYEDIDLGEIGCVRKIMRTWTVREWWCNTEIVRTAPQLIIIEDTEGPEITHMPYGFEATTGRR
ncbi:MAG TPA: lectin-like protein, partial [Saprospiraceae bacterium]|nr:lectin-like protein [Saprospiraceae bacterium]